MVPFSLFLALKYLKPKRSFISVVTAISVVGVLLGVAILVIVLSVMTGFDNMWRDKILSFKPHLTVVGRLGPVQNEEEVCRTVEAIPGISGAAPVIQTLVLMQHAGMATAPVVVGVPPERAARVSRVPDFVPEGAFDIEGDHAVVGIDLARSMRLGVGDRVLVYSPQNVVSPDEMYLPEELTVTGLFELGMWDFDSRFMLTSLDTARDLSGVEQGADAVHIMTADPFRFDEYAARVREALGPACVVRTWREVDELMFSALSHEKTIMFVLLVFITIVAIFCVTNTLIVITVHKTHEIGLLKAIGFSSAKIMAAFVLHGWIQCLAGVAAGIGLGLLVLNNLNAVAAWLGSMNLNVFPKEIYRLSEIPWSTSFGEIARIALFVMVFCTLASIIPAGWAARLDPVEALRKE
ncbi:MAG: ABC transporter permease [Lentisphaerae bacterium]|nr:ABC transporter permease [Lentisphaerota bacterium]